MTSEMEMTMTLTGNSRYPIEHELKTWQSYFHALADGSKNFEIRRDDRGYRVGDTLWLRETEYGSGAYTGREARRKIAYILRREEDLGLINGFAILSLEPLTAERDSALAQIAVMRGALEMMVALDDCEAHFEDAYERALPFAKRALSNLPEQAKAITHPTGSEEFAAQLESLSVPAPWRLCDEEIGEVLAENGDIACVAGDGGDIDADRSALAMYIILAVNTLAGFKAVIP